MEHWFRSALLITADFSSSHDLADGLSRLFGAHFKAAATLPRDVHWNIDTLVVIDRATLPMTQTRQLATAVCSETPAGLIIANADEEAYLDLIPFSALKGVLANPVSMRALIRAVSALQRGELCFSRRLMSRQMEEQRKPTERFTPPDGLTAREWRVLSLIVEGHSNAVIASLLHLSPHTVKSHAQNIFRKISASNRTQAARWARNHTHLQVDSSAEEKHEVQRTVA